MIIIIFIRHTLAYNMYIYIYIYIVHKHISNLYHKNINIHYSSATAIV